MSFPSCATPAGGNIALGTITVYNLSGSATNLLVKRHNDPSNSGFQCPLFIVCDIPVYTKWCMTPSTAPPCSLSTKAGLAYAMPADDPVVFSATLNGEGTEGGSVGLFPDRQVIAMFDAGVIQLPSGERGATLQSTIVTSSAVADVFEDNEVEYIERAFPTFTPADTVAVARTGEVVRMTDLTDVYILRVPVGHDPTLLASELAVLLEEVGYAEVDVVAEAAVCNYSGSCAATISCPNDELFNSQWSLYNAGQGGGVCDADIDAFESWMITTGSASTKIGIIDSGVDGGHEDLMGKVSGDPGFGGTPTFIPEHGTHVAGIAAAYTNNTLGIAGVDRNAQIVSQRIAGEDAPGIAAAVRDAVLLGEAQVLNNSWTIPNSTTVRLAFRDVYMLNAMAAAAMGNDGVTTTNYPAAFPNIVAVGATTRSDVIWTSSTRGDHIDVVAPGVGIWSTVPASLYPAKYVPFNGTSMATPHVCGTAGLLLSYGSFLGKTLYNDDLEHLIRLSAEETPLDPVEGWDPTYGTGRVNAEAALKLLQFPFELSQGSETGGAPVGNTDWYTQIFLVRPPGAPIGTQYFVRRYEVRRAVTFPIGFQSTPSVWARGSATVGWKNENPHYGEGWCEVVPGTLTSTGCTFRTYVYEVRKLGLGTPFVGWWPAHWNDVRFAYTAHGEVTASDAGEEDETASPTAVRLVVPNPVRPGATIALFLPRETNIRLELFDVAGRRVRVLHDGRLVSGRHVLPWDRLVEQGGMLPSGLYFTRLQSESGVLNQKTVVVR